MYPDDRIHPGHLSSQIADLAEAPPDDWTRQFVLDAARRNPDYDHVEVHELIEEMGGSIELKHVIGAMQGL